MGGFLVFDLNGIVSTLFEYLEKKKRLQNPLEQSKLLANVPTVIPDVHELELNCNSGDIINDTNSDATVPNEGWQDDKASERKQLVCEDENKVENISSGKTGFATQQKV